MDIVRSKSDTECTIAGLYDLSQTIGKGHFAVVKLAKHVFTGEKVAVKVIDKTKLDPISREHLFQEVRCMKLVQHPHIVRLYEVIDTQTKLYLILELGDGDMYDYIINNHDHGLDIDTARVYFTQILEGISYCHDLHVVHRDLKPENVIFFEKLGIVKLTDFGFSNRFEPDTKLDTSCGSLAYSAPEILLGDSYDAPAVDVWSLGVLLFMLVTGEPPFQEANDSETLTMIMDCKYRIPSHVPADCAQLISMMLRREPKERISLRDIMQHPWMTVGGGQCCDNFACVALVGRQHLSKDDHDAIIQRMVDGGIATRSEIIKALEADSYSNVTATFFLLAERRLKKQHEHRPVINRRASSAPRPPRLGHSLSTPPDNVHTESAIQTRDSLPGDHPKSAPPDKKDGVFSLDSYSSLGADTPTQTEETGEHHRAQSRLEKKFSLICEEDEDMSDTDELTDTVITVKETKSAVAATTPSRGSPNVSNGSLANMATDFEQSLSNMSLRRMRQQAAAATPRPLRTVTSSPQLLPLKQIHEEGEVTSDEDALSTHSQTSLVRMRHSSLSMASPEIARKILSKKKKAGKSTSGSDTSDNDEDKHRDTLNLPHKRKDSSDNGSDTDGPGPAAGTNAAQRHGSRPHGSRRSSSNKDSPSAKKKYGGKSAADSTEATESSDDVTIKSECTNTEVGTNTIILVDSVSNTPRTRPKKTNGNNNCKDDNSLRVLASKLVDSSLARLSNFSLASQTSSQSSRSSARQSERGSRSSRDPKFSKTRLMQKLKMDFSELSDRELTDSECGSLQNSIRVKLAVGAAAGDYSVITEEQPSYVHKKKSADCCSVM